MTLKMKIRKDDTKRWQSKRDSTIDKAIYTFRKLHLEEEMKQSKGNVHEKGILKKVIEEQRRTFYLQRDMPI
ncbi:uncharacterized protein MONOS_15385 [Monocercomonoides exilis]|uniref:uncharacterized protein n=1 Tax=Monocercomonoides exilis TaxID=2049356 RepID=UPI003559E233|nr:hypothetical protein MONOS_15385 [Monocercomonoides exilis]|eukprot:MONOS_15385.1-p1 / transcript=MONOS_15385.1 / gene=MONOS_15385 / organism=Monocercomonoides_exilis_PA203 / gene_product=unspecified product / transcript_product=unspecified product / location=Mono_scaffold01215:6970-7240(+) / protein_length=72 / sequence_SO=supercontig / SO=protein_coding / is_pseudo=false